MKSLILTITVVLSIACWSNIAAQNTVMTPESADMIFTLRGGKLLEKVSLQEMKEIDAVNNIFAQMVRASGESGRKIDELGINLYANAQLFMSFKEEGTMLMGTTFELDDVKVFKSIFMKDAEIKNELGVEYSVSDGYTRAIKGNQGLITYAVITPSYEKESFYYDETPIAPEYYYDENTLLEEDIVETIPYEEEAAEQMEIIEDSINLEYLKEIESIEELSYYEQLEIEETVQIDEITNYSKNYALELLANNFSTATSLDSKMVDPKADFSLVINGSSSLFKYMMNSTPGTYKSSTVKQLEAMMDDMYADFKWMSLNGFYDKDELRVESNAKLGGDMSEWCAEMMNAEVNPEMLKYIPYNDQIAFVSGAYDTKSILNGYYGYLKKMVKSLPSEEGIDVGEVSSIIIDFVDLFLDENAISQLIKGDFYAGITDINTYDVEYTTYEYDEEWNYKEITGIKQEVLPDFLIMFSSEDEKNINNFFRLAEISSNGEFKKENNYYKLAAGKESPIDIYAMQKEGIVFIFSSQVVLDFIQNGGGSPSSKQKSSITDYSSVMRINGEELANKVPLEDLPTDAKSMVDFMRETAGNISFTQKKIMRDVLSSEVTLSTRGEHANSLDYFLSTFNELINMNQSNNTLRN
ncbi:MAG TPA: hypothetical protein DHU89_00590 [Flavobacteriales bacterium]|nr:hypothetical protein [Flavobacteriales bacterium]